LDGLALQTGLYVCLFATCGHVYDSSQPFWYRMDNVMDFWEDVMNVGPDELVCKLEQWACRQGKSKLSHMHTGVVAKKKIQINFINFEVAIKEKYSINLCDWPEGVPFQSPHAITSAEHLWTLCDALKAGTCQWAYMSRQQHLEYQD
ncbi:hypothetical protein PISMIDRAFT_105415, partial [Pisolithus microcarpus 441]